MFFVSVILVFMLGYLTHRELSNISRFGTDHPRGNIQIYYILYESNNTYFPSVFFNIKENSRFKRRTKLGKEFTRNKINVDKYLNLNENLQLLLQLFSGPKSKFKKNFKRDFRYPTGTQNNSHTTNESNNENVKQALTIGSENNNQIDIIEEVPQRKLDENIEFFNESKNNYETTISKEINQNELLSSSEHWKKLNERALVEFDNSSVIIVENTTLILEVFEEAPTSTNNSLRIKNVLIDATTNECSRILGRINITDVHNKLIRGLLPDNGKTSKILSSSHKLDNGVYIVKNPCLHENCKILNTLTLDITFENVDHLSSSFLQLFDEAKRNIFIPLENNLQTRMTIYCEDMSLFDYTFKDFFRYLSHPSYVLFIAAVILFIIAVFCRTQYSGCFYSFENYRGDNYEKNSESRPLTKVEILKLLLDVKEVQNESLTKMEDVLEKTNIKLQHVFQKLVFIEDFAIRGREHKMKELHENLRRIQINLAKTFYQQIAEIKFKYNKSVEDIHTLSYNLEETRNSLNELHSRLNDFIKGQPYTKRTGGLQSSTNYHDDSIKVMPIFMNGSCDHHAQSSNNIQIFDENINTKERIPKSEVNITEITDDELTFSENAVHGEMNFLKVKRITKVNKTGQDKMTHHLNDINLFPKTKHSSKAITAPKRQLSGTQRTESELNQKPEIGENLKVDLKHQLVNLGATPAALQTNPLFKKQMCQNLTQ